MHTIYEHIKTHYQGTKNKEQNNCTSNPPSPKNTILINYFFSKCIIKMFTYVLALLNAFTHFFDFDTIKSNSLILFKFFCFNIGILYIGFYTRLSYRIFDSLTHFEKTNSLKTIIHLNTVFQSNI